MIAIFKKEFNSYMHSVLGWLFIAVTVCIFAMYATAYNLVYGTPYLAYSLQGLIFVLLITVPILSMKIMADERRQKTDQLLLTTPVSVGKIILGKYLAMAAIFLIPILLFCLMPPFLSKYGTVPMAENYVAILAYALYGLAALAVGLFISSITENLVIAAVLSFAVLFVTYMMEGIESLISSTGNIITQILGAFDFYSHYSNMVSSVTDATGNSRLTTVFDLTTVIYFVSVIALLLFLSTQSVQKRRYTVSVKNRGTGGMALGAYSSVSIVIAIVLTVLVNLIVGKLPSKYTGIDVTSNQLYSITDQTKQIVSNLDTDVNIYVLASEDNADSVLKQTLDRYTDLTDKINVEYVNPMTNPKFASNYTSDSVSQNSLIVESEKRYKVINYSDIYEVEYSYSGYSYSSEVTGYDGEGQITSAISYCTSDEMPKIYVIQGHSELSLDSGFTTAIEKENIDYETISLMDYDEVPEDAECLIIHAPETDFSTDDAQKVIDYLNNGGKAIITTEYTGADLPNFNSIISEFGMTIEEGCIIDTNQQNYYQSPIYLLPNVEYADETSGLTGSYTYLMTAYAEGITIPDYDVEDIEYTKLLTTSSQAILKQITGQTISMEMEEGDVEGTFNIGVKAVKTIDDDNSAVLYVFSGARLFTDSFDSYVSGNNKQLFSNIMGTIADHEVSVSIPVKSYELEWLTTSESDAFIFRSIVMFVIPLVLVIIGIVVWVRRRKQ
jgi:ABC-2 type transport system permease protein